MHRAGVTPSLSRLTKGTKEIYHLEAFVAKFMAIYTRFVEETMSGF